MERLQDALDGALASIVEWLPQLLGALIIILIGHWVAKALSRGVKAISRKFRIDDRLKAAQGGNVIQRAVPHPTGLLAKITYWLVFIGGVSLAATVLGIEALDRLVSAVYGYVPQIIAAIIIFMIGSAIAAGVTALVRNTMGHTPTGKVLETIFPLIVMGITVFAILDQLNIAPTIVTITYAALLGSVALGSALAFGLGGRDVAARMLESSYEKGRENIGQVKRDLKTGKQRAEAKAEKTKRRNR